MKRFKGTFKKSGKMAIGGEIKPYELLGSNGVEVELDTSQLFNFNPNQYLNAEVVISGDYVEEGVERRRWVFVVTEIQRA